ncbi:hypothetical protein LV457_09665 [Mycobacterium sp. MYCO198283]|uniref:hypothetical protein n=1 Tax=Mycobacterium sp. MYCO198283 TaxID=2883505 RepID=UPI001E40225C|nr:hypothetical protein [Mycobacterium sp. MYCO198283]MCG5432555.1 hypothetical protein [Mycobacterium sp. MYCO198283]
MTLQERLLAVLGEVLPVTEEADGAITVRHEGAPVSLRVVPIADDLELVSLSTVLAWDMALTKAVRAKIAGYARDSMLGSVILLEKKSQADVLLRYNFPGSGLSDDALRTLILMVLGIGADIRRELMPAKSP